MCGDLVCSIPAILPPDFLQLCCPDGGGCGAQVKVLGFPVCLQTDSGGM
jgi:hypothetical protein